MTIIATCGHDVTNTYCRTTLYYWGYDGGDRVLCFGSVCTRCRANYDIATQAEVEAYGSIPQSWEVKEETT